jgi:TolB-like protein
MRVILAFICSLILFGCANIAKQVPSNTLSGDLINASYQIADTLLMNQKYPISESDSIIVATFVNINNLRESSTFGRLVAEQISSRLSQKGYSISELRLRTDSVFMEERKGEFLLSRDLKDVSRKHNAAAVVVGTYGYASGEMYVSAKIVNPADGTVISSCDYLIKFPSLDRQASLLKSN